ncbi:MAG: D-alanyl-D-alanine carboxypeptidase [Methylococcaceae bacterium]|nr:D-alanyl-D-alanine carboxypeptidase [Methylococcaceae bacterium]
MFGCLSAANAKYASILIDAESGRVLHEENADTLNYPASLTKMMTLYLVFSALESHQIRLNTRWRVSLTAARQPPTKLGLKAGRTITVRDCILALVTKSANDMAVVIAEGLAGSEFRFARMMTEKSLDLNMRQTTFRNASGLPDEEQRTTARDIAILALALFRDFPDYYPFFSARTFQYGKRLYRNHNELLHSYPGTDGIKTGYIRASGYNLAASTVRNGRRLIGVVLGGITSNDRNQQMMTLLSRGFAMLEGERYPLDPGFTLLEQKGSVFDRGFSKFEQKQFAFEPRISNLGQERPVFNRTFATLEGERYPFDRGSTKLEHERSAFDRRSAKFSQKRPRYLQNLSESRPLMVSKAEDQHPGKPDPSQASIEKHPRPVKRRPKLEWGIQVGAFASFKPAQGAALRAKASASQFLRSSRTVISPYRKRKGFIYRARLVGIDQHQARKACKILLAKQISCIAVPPSKQLAEFTSR